MEVEPLGETALLLRSLEESPAMVARKLRKAMPDLLDVVPCYETVGLFFDGTPPSLEEIEEGLLSPAPDIAIRKHRIPVCYEMGPDLERCAGQLTLRNEELIKLHCNNVYLCAAVGFTPGFAYLGELDSRIATLPRLPSPRPRVEAGSVGITGKQTAVYPSVSPGGWNIIGRTPLTLVDVADGYFPIAAGDSVEFFPIPRDEFESLVGERL